MTTFTVKHLHTFQNSVLTHKYLKYKFKTPENEHYLDYLD